MRVANESSPRTRSDASRATAVPLPIATATSAPWRAGASFTPSPVTATIRCSARATRTRRCFCSGVDRATTCRSGSSAASRASSHAATSSPVDDPLGIEARLAGDGRRRPGVVAGDHDDLDARARGPWPSRRRSRAGSGRRSRRGPASRQGSSSIRRARATSRSPASAVASIRTVQRPRSRASMPPLASTYARTTSGAPRARLSICPSRQARVLVTGSASDAGIASTRSRRVEARACRRAPPRRPGVRG